LLRRVRSWGWRWTNFRQLPVFQTLRRKVRGGDGTCG
jgi:hypothetical protein